MKTVNASSETLSFLLSNRDNASCWAVLKSFLLEIRQKTSYRNTFDQAEMSPSQAIALSILSSRYRDLSSKQIAALLAAAVKHSIPFYFHDDALAFLEHQRLPSINVNSSFDYEVDGTSIQSAVLVPRTDPDLGLHRLPSGSPIASLFTGKRAGESFTLNGKHYTIANVYARKD